jgi:hypothetical protein
MGDISAFGSSIRLVASNTFPQGIQIDQFSDEADPFDFASMDIAAFEMDINGNPITWSIANGIPFTLNILPGSETATDMNTLFDANRSSFNKRSAFDEITITVIYPSGDKKVLSKGVLLNGTPGTGVTSEGKKKPKTYGFMFGAQTGV